MNDSVSQDFRPVGPVVQFALLIVPVVMNGFFVVYALTGWVIEGRDRLNWALEAGGVALWVGVGMLGFCALVVAFVRFAGGGWRHPLVVSSVLHALFALLLALSVVVSVGLALRS